jgi:type III pantothenate kinase
VILVIDAGNTRLKYGLRALGDPLHGRWTETGRIDYADAGALEAALARLVSGSAVSRVIASNVAGDATRVRIESALSAVHVVHWVNAASTQLGVVNSYDEPERLGPDRWCGLIAAWHRRHRACVVVNCGTATTIDGLDATGRFVGGMILPGLALMKRALAGNTARLPLAAGRFDATPRNTDDAIETGCIDAQCGAIERFAKRMRVDDCLMSGGAAPLIAVGLNIPYEHVDPLTLEGLTLIGQSATPASVTKA